MTRQKRRQLILRKLVKWGPTPPFVKPNEIYYLRKPGEPYQPITSEELRKLGPTLQRLADYDKEREA